MDHTEVYASCDFDRLIDFNGGNGELNSALTFPADEPLSWFPINDDDTVADEAAIHFTINRDDAAPYSGTIYIKNIATDGLIYTYTATLAGEGLYLSQSMEEFSDVSGIIALSSP